MIKDYRKSTEETQVLDFSNATLKPCAVISKNYVNCWEVVQEFYETMMEQYPEIDYYEGLEDNHLLKLYAFAGIRVRRGVYDLYDTYDQYCTVTSSSSDIYEENIFDTIEELYEFLGVKIVKNLNEEEPEETENDFNEQVISVNIKILTVEEVVSKIRKIEQEIRDKQQELKEAEDSLKFLEQHLNIRIMVK